MGLNTTPHTWAINELVLAATLNTEIRDAFIGLQAVWDTYTPVWGSAGTTPTLGNGVMLGHFRQVGKTIDFHIELTIGSTTNPGTGVYTLTLPFSAAVAANAAIAAAHVYDASGPTYNAHTAVRATSAGAIALAGPAGSTRWSSTSPAAPATGDVVSVTGTYESV